MSIPSRTSLVNRAALCLLPILIGLSAALALLVLAGGPVRLAYANNTTFPGCGATIQACIDSAATGDTILISAGDYTESLTLSKAVSLTGALSSTTILHALPNTRVLTVTGAAVDSSVVISGLTFTGGLVTGTLSCPQSCGGGILITGTAQPVLSNLRLMNNTAGFFGGGLYADSGLALAGSFIDNIGGYGGGAFVRGPVTLAGVQLVRNTSRTRGGGLYAVGAATLVDSTFLSNTSQYEGGGLFAQFDVALTNTQFISNVARQAAGGGLSAGGAVIVSGALFANNAALGHGGGADTWGPVVVSAASFSQNTASGSGGGLYVQGDVTVTGSSFVSNSATHAPDTGGGGLYAGGLAVVTDTAFSNNLAINGGGLYVGGSAALAGDQFAGNVAYTFGGGLYAGGASTITGTQFMTNTNYFGYGGGLYVLSAAALTATQFSGNNAYRGGGAYLAGSDLGQRRLVNSLFAHNLSGGSGNDVYIDLSAASAVLLFDTFTDPYFSFGAAVFVTTGTVTITNTIIASHTAGIQVNAGTVSQDYNLFSSNVWNVTGTVSGGSHSLTGAPHFTDPGGDYHLLYNSSARHLGLDAGVTTDFEGDPRPFRGGFDVGYDQFIDPPPTAVDDNYHTLPNTTLSVPAPGVLSNDHDVDQEPMTVTLVQDAVTGTLNLAASGAFTYFPLLGFSGLVTFTYQADDGFLPSAPAVVVIAVGQPPLASANASQTTTVGMPVALDGSGSSDPQGYLPLVYDWRQTGGPAVILSNSAISRPTFTAPVTPAVLKFSLTVSDVYGLSSLPATTTVTVTDQPISGLSLANTDLTALGQPTLLTASLAAGTNVIYSWSFGDSGAATTGLSPSVGHTYATFGVFPVVVTATNSLGSLTTTTTVKIDDIPLAASDVYSTTENAPLNAAAPGVLANDSDTYPGGLTAQLVAPPITGTLVLAANGAFTFTPLLNFTGLVTFSYRASDGLLLSPATTVTITVNAFKLYLPLVGR